MMRDEAMATKRRAAEPRTPTVTKTAPRATRAPSLNSKAARRARAAEIAAALEAANPHPQCDLDFTTPFELLVATILSAQTTDKGVNKVTPELFRRWPDAHALAGAPQAEVETIVRSTGYYRQKAKNIIAAAKILVDKHGGQVPRTMDELLELPGVARKTANVVLGTGFGIPTGIPVDTHVNRVTRRLGLTRAEDPVAIERDLMALYPPERWIGVGQRMVLHGRYVCVARGPRCEACPLLPHCRTPEAKKTRAALAAASTGATRDGRG